MTPAEMQAEWLAKNRPTKCPDSKVAQSHKSGRIADYQYYKDSTTNSQVGFTVLAGINSRRYNTKAKEQKKCECCNSLFYPRKRVKGQTKYCFTCSSQQVRRRIFLEREREQRATYLTEKYGKPFDIIIFRRKFKSLRNLLHKCHGMEYPFFYHSNTEIINLASILSNFTHSPIYLRIIDKFTPPNKRDNYSVTGYEFDF